jgi:DNA-binding GntR family transcriptional regulator
MTGRFRAQDHWTEHAGILAAVIAGDGELAALLAIRHVHNAAAAFAKSSAAASEQAD